MGMGRRQQARQQEFWIASDSLAPVHEQVFAFVLDIARQKKLLVGKQVGVDATTVEPHFQRVVRSCAEHRLPGLLHKSEAPNPKF